MPIWLLPNGLLLGIWMVLLFFLASIVDIASLPLRQHLELKRILPSSFYLGEKIIIAIEIFNASRYMQHGLLCDDIPEALGGETKMLTWSILAKHSCRLEWAACPQKRGQASFGLTLWRANGLLGLWHKDVVVDLTQEVALFPAKLLPLQKQFQGLGRNVNNGRIINSGQRAEIDFLRPMYEGEEWRSVDWKQSANKNRWIVREYKEGISCQISLFIDCGRAMGEIIGAKSRLDHSINASLQICRAAEKNGDEIALTAFSNHIHMNLPLVNRGQFCKALKSLYGIGASEGESDYWKVFGQALHQLKKRSLIILFSDILDSCASNGISYQLCLAAQRHKVICCMLKDPALNLEAINDDLHRSTAAKFMSIERAVAIAKMRQGGVSVIEIEESHFHTSILQHYIETRGKV
ncbi:MAG: DUF58 domain-containing protein [Parachlamydiaceae bacterium]|nr:DUF58 domain-containing protein [Parachlamydiaceae bacterium]